MKDIICRISLIKLCYQRSAHMEEIIIDDVIYLVTEDFQNSKSLVDILIDLLINFERINVND